MKKYLNIAILTLLMLNLTSCEVEFSPNAEWKEIPVVYCVLDQAEDTTWIRVQKCFLGDENLYNYTSVPDSSNYPQGELEVKLLQWKASKIGNTNFLKPIGDAPNKEFVCQYTTRLKEDGLFNWGTQPLYYCRTSHQLDTNCMYQLVVLRASTGDTVAQAMTSLLGGDARLTKINSFSANSPSAIFKFVGVNRDCQITWLPWSRGRLYQPKVRFYYMENGQKCHLDIKCNNVKDYGRSSSLSTTLNKGTFMAEIEKNLGRDTNAKGFVHYVDFYVDACNEDLNAYINSVRALHSGSNNSQVYTNIENGIGVFASRRSMMVTIPSDSAVGPATYLQDLVDLGVGFEKSLNY